MRTTLGIGVLAMAAVLATGCAGDRVTHGDITGKPTPELKTTSLRNSEVKTSLAYMRNQNGRAFWDDLGRTVYWDQPTRLSPFPVVSLNGQPR